MNKLYYTALFVHRPTGKVLFRLSEKPINKYMWEKAKALKFEELAKDRFINKSEIDIRDYGTNQAE